MKRFLNQALIVTLLSTLASCHKDSVPPNLVERKVHYILYTNKDFSGDNHTITFSVFIRKNNTILLDSVLSPMKIKDIPNMANKIEIDKLVPNNDPSDLTVGFLYTIEGVGNSWFLDTCSRGQTFKVLEYPFQ